MTALDDFQAVYERIKAMPPIAVAFWCVDCPGRVWRMRALVEQVRDAMASPIPTPLGILSIPVYEWYSWLADDEDKKKRPECFNVPGVYAKMSDGTYQKVGT